jgi:SNF2 family DNA or RNA helicase
MAPEQRGAYQRLDREYEFSTTLEGGARRTLSVASAIAKVTRLQQIAAGILPLTSVEGDAEEVGRYRGLPSPKTEWVVDYLKDALSDTDAQFVVWTRFQPEIDRLAEALKVAGIEGRIIDGRTPDAARRESLRRYDDRADPLRVLLVNLQAGAYGLDIRSADVMIFHSSTYSILDRLQAEDRGHRAGRTRNYQIIDLLLEGTVDMLMDESRQKRLDLIRTLVGEGVRT